MASIDSTVTNTANQKLGNKTVTPPVSGKTFAQILSGELSGDAFLAQLPPKVIMGRTVRVKISKAAYESGLAACQTHLHGRLILHKGDAPITTQALKAKLNVQWPQLLNWNLIPLGKGFFEFRFNSVEDMRRIWALGTVNLKPGLLRFYCWSKDFAPQAQSQTHAQVWVRFLNLPQEYWEKHTLFEIASGLGTPLSIDEATQHRRLGIFARVLVDVNLSETMFESVVVERDDHALSVSIQYEKFPLFCANCKMIGHSLQNCSKLGASEFPFNGPVKYSQGANLKKPVNDSVYQAGKKKHVEFKVSNTALQSQYTGPARKNNYNETLTEPMNATSSQVSKNTEYMHNNAEIETHQTPAFDVGVGESDKHTTNQKSDKIQTSGDTIILHNAFDLLETDTEQDIVNAPIHDKESPFTNMDTQIDKNPSVKENSKGLQHLSQITVLEDHGKLGKRVSKSVHLSSGTSPVSYGKVDEFTFEMLETSVEQHTEQNPTTDKESTLTNMDRYIDKNPGVGVISQGQKHFTHITFLEGSSSLEKRTSNSEILSSGTLPVSYVQDNVTTLDDQTILQPLTSPIITRDEILGKDKKQVKIVNMPGNTAAACLKDGKVLRKFWCEDSDSTIDPETDSEPQNITIPTSSQYLESNTVNKSKRGRPKKQRSPKNKAGISSTAQETENVHTRSQTGSKPHNNNKNIP